MGGATVQVVVRFRGGYRAKATARHFELPEARRGIQGNDAFQADVLECFSLLADSVSCVHNFLQAKTVMHFFRGAASIHSLRESDYLT
jgi:hypothetical protein